MHIMIKNKLLLMKNIFTKQFRHFFLILFAVLLILQLLGSGTFIITKTKQLLFTVFITSCLTSIFSYSRIYFYNYLLALLPLLSLLFCKTAAGEVITSVNIAYYSIFSLSFTNIIFFLYYYSLLPHNVPDTRCLLKLQASIMCVHVLQQKNKH